MVSCDWVTVTPSDPELRPASTTLLKAAACSDVKGHRLLPASRTIAVTVAGFAAVASAAGSGAAAGASAGAGAGAVSARTGKCSVLVVSHALLPVPG